MLRISRFVHGQENAIPVNVSIDVASRKARHGSASLAIVLSTLLPYVLTSVLLLHWCKRSLSDQLRWQS